MKNSRNINVMDCLETLIRAQTMRPTSCTATMKYWASFTRSTLSTFVSWTPPATLRRCRDPTCSMAMSRSTKLRLTSCSRVRSTTRSSTSATRGSRWARRCRDTCFVSRVGGWDWSRTVRKIRTHPARIDPWVKKHHFFTVNPGFLSNCFLRGFLSFHFFSSFQRQCYRRLQFLLSSAFVSEAPYHFFFSKKGAYLHKFSEFPYS